MQSTGLICLQPIWPDVPRTVEEHRSQLTRAQMAFSARGLYSTWWIKLDGIFIFGIDFNILLCQEEKSRCSVLRMSTFLDDPPRDLWSCPVNYYTSKSQEDLGKNACCSQKLSRKANFCSSVEEEGMQYWIF